MDEAINHAINRISHAPVRQDPFPHFYLDNVFPEQFYQELIGSFPPLIHYKNSHPYPERYKLSLSQAELKNLPLNHRLFWSRFAKSIYSKEFLLKILDKFHEQVSKRLGPNFSDNVYPSVILTSDRDHYSISPHTDVPAKVITLLFYLPENHDQKDLGTALYCPKDLSFTSEGHEHYEFESFIKIGKAPFLPNSVFGFLKTNNSFHGVEPIGKQVKGRNLLTYTIWEHSLSKMF